MSQRPSPHGLGQYVLVTAAYNEAGLVEKTIDSVAAQCLQPLAWVIVSDGSTDQTDSIIQRWAERLTFLRYVRLERRPGHDFASKIRAVGVGFDLLRELDYDFIGNLDADVSFGPDYFSSLLEQFASNDSLGLAGGWIHEDAGSGFVSRLHNSSREVPHSVQMLRRQCHQEIGDYLPLPYGGEDTVAAVAARMRGWQVQAFPELPVKHHRRTGNAAGLLRGAFRAGRSEYSVGYQPCFHLLKALARSVDQPYLVGSVLRLAGYAYEWSRRQHRPVPSDFVAYLRAEQIRRMGFKSVFCKGD